LTSATHALHFSAGTSAEIPAGLMADMARYRHQVFVGRLGWTLPCGDEFEYDTFDRDDTVYVLAQAGGQVVGVARLLPSTQPYLLGHVFQNLLGAAPIPCHPQVWELSRFSAMSLHASTARERGQFSSPTAVTLLRESLRCAAGLGAHRVVTVSPLGVERLLKRAGFRAERLGVPAVMHGTTLFACSIGCMPQDIPALTRPRA